MPGARDRDDVVFLSQDELRKLFAVIPGHGDRAIFPLAYHHGLRASEVSLLLREDVDRRRGRIRIHRLKGSIPRPCGSSAA